MSVSTEVSEYSVRQSIAARTPPRLRRLVRMALNYTQLIKMWLLILAQLRPSDRQSRKTLWLSAAAALATDWSQLDKFQKPIPLGDLVVDIPGIGRFSIRANTDDLFSIMPAREHGVRSIVEGCIGPGSIFVDGGANLGFYSILAAKRAGSGGRVIAFEMMPDTAALLRSNVAANGPLAIEIDERALSDRDGQSVNASVEPGQHGQASIVKEGAHGRKVIEVKTVTLDSALLGYGPIDLIKLDLEGAEYAALQGAKSVLARTSCVVFESNERDHRIFDLLADAGFLVEKIEGFDFVAKRVTGLK
jgi:FkbM family methyltransferase